MTEVISRESVVSLKDFLQLERMTVDNVNLDFNKAIDSVSHNILIGMLGKFEIDQWTVRWIENWLPDRDQSITLSSV